MIFDIYGLGCVHPNVATSMSELEKLYQYQRKLEEALKMNERCFGMRQVIHSEEYAHPGIAASLCNLGRLYRE